MKPDFSIVATWDKGRPLEELNKLIAKRARWLDGSDAALYSAAHTILRSLKPLVRVAKTTKTALRQSYDLTDTGLEMGQCRNSHGKMKWHPHHRFQPDYRRDIRPICLWGGGLPQHRVHVYRIVPRYGAGRRTWSKNLNKGCWYIAAYNEGIARNYAEGTLMKRAVAKYAGMARAAVVAMRRAVAKSGNDAPEILDESGYFVMAYGGKRLIDEVSAMAKCELRRSGLMKEMEVSSELSYARAALRDPNALDYAIAKAANSIAGYMRHAAESNFLIPSVETPFPEISRNGSFRR